MSDDRWRTAEALMDVIALIHDYDGWGRPECFDCGTGPGVTHHKGCALVLAMESWRCATPGCVRLVEYATETHCYKHGGRND